MLNDVIVPSFAPREAAEAINYEKVAKVFTGKHTSMMYDRQEAILVKLERIYKNGLVRKDLPQLAIILDLAREKIDAGAESLIPSFDRLLSLANSPFACHLPGEAEATPADHISQLALTLAKVTGLKNVATAELAARALLNLVGGKPSTKSASNPKVVFINPMKMKQKEVKKAKDIESKAQQERETYFLQIEKSDVIETLLNTLKGNHEFRIQLAILKILRKMASSFPSAKKMNHEDALVTFLGVIYNTQEDSVFALTTEVIWNLLSFKDKHRVAAIINGTCRAAFRQHGRSLLSETLEKVCKKTLHYGHKNLRNEYMIIVNSVVELCPETALAAHESGFIEKLGHYMMSHELGGMMNIIRMSISKKADSVIVPKFHFTNSAEDYEFKKILMQLAMQLCAEEGNLMCLLTAGLLEFLLLYLQLDCTNEGVNVWTDRQLQGLQLQVIGFLNTIIPRIPQRWAAVNGNSALLNYLSKALKGNQNEGDSVAQNITTSNANNGGDAAGLVNNPSTGLVGGTLRLLSRISELGPSQKRALGMQGAFSVLIAILTDRSQRPDIWRAAFLICSSLCQGCKSNKTLFGESGGVEMILPFLIYSSADPKETDSVILAAVECIWGSICGSGANEACFFACDGLFAMLDLLPKSSYVSQRHILGALLDLLENPKARSHILEWRSSENEQRGVVNLLIKLWTLEEQRMGVPTGHYGTLVDEKKPLAGKYQKGHEDPSKKYEDGYVVEELSENLRSKIYSMFCKLGFDGFSEVITVEEQIKLALIAKYLDFKIGEVWEEISEELDNEGIRPISPDLDCINTAKQVIVEKAQAIQGKQADFIKRKNESERLEEDLFYNTYIKQRGITPRALTPSQ
ncbi:armadillo-type protein [Obelidium mucronatum]|nr:armadillo-type protein [Obelidium mucronatum]